MTPDDVIAVLSLAALAAADTPEPTPDVVRDFVRALDGVRLVDVVTATGDALRDGELVTASVVAGRVDTIRQQRRDAERGQTEDRHTRYRRQLRESIASGHVPVPAPRPEDVQTLTDDALGGWCSWCKAIPEERCYDPKRTTYADDGSPIKVYVRVPHAVRIRERRAARAAGDDVEPLATEPVELEPPAPQPATRETAPPPLADDPWSLPAGDPR